MKITVLAGGVGGARFVRGLLDHLQRPCAQCANPHPELADSSVTVIGNTGDDITLFGLRVCPDVDTIMYTLGGGIEESQGWGRSDEAHVLASELAAYGVGPDWFTLGDRDLATHVARSQWLGQGMTLTEVTARLARRWGLPELNTTLLPMTDTPVETHVVIDDGQRRAVHFQEWWVRMHAQVPAEQFVVAGLDQATMTDPVRSAIEQADVILLPPSNPVVSIGVILSVPGIRAAITSASAPVVGVSPLIAGAPVRGYADACLAALGLPSTSRAVASLYADFLRGWLVAPADADAESPGKSGAESGAESGWPEGVAVRTHPLLMSDRAAAADLAAATLDLALSLRVPA